VQGGTDGPEVLKKFQGGAPTLPPYFPRLCWRWC